MSEAPYTVNLDSTQVTLLTHCLVHGIKGLFDPTISPEFRVHSTVKIKNIAKRLLRSISDYQEMVVNNGLLIDSEIEVTKDTIKRLKDISSYPTLHCLREHEIRNFNAIKFLSSVDLDDYSEEDEPELYALRVKQFREKLFDSLNESENDDTHDW